MKPLHLQHSFLCTNEASFNHRFTGENVTSSTFRKRGTSPHTTIALDVGEHPRVLTPHPPPAPDVLGDSQEVRFVCGCGYNIAHSARDIQVQSRHKICSHLRGFSTTWPHTFTVIAAAQTPAVVQSLPHLQLPRLHVPTTQFRKWAPAQIC